MKFYTANRVLTGEQGEVHAGAGVLVDGDTIAWVGPAAELPPDYGAVERVELGDLTLLPGLIDSHVHLGFDGGPAPVERMKAESDPQQLVLMLRSARELLSVGVTTARDLGARSFLDVVVRDAIDTGIARGPRMVTAGRPLTVTGGHCWFMGGECDTDDEVRRMVRLHHKMGVDLIKVMSTGGFMTAGSAPWFAQFTDGQLAAAVGEAHRLGKRVAAHAHGVEGIRRALDAGVDTLEHCSFVLPDGRMSVDDELVARIVASGAYVCPTVNTRYAEFLATRGEDFKPSLPVLHERGAKIIAGTDAGIDNVPHYAYVAGLEALAMVGLPADQVLYAATARAAEALGLGEVTGRLRPGLSADLIAVEGDPLADISALHSLRLVVARGTPFQPDPVGEAALPAPPAPTGLAMAKAVSR
ncbi:metal-dependent hydrolase family protein [Amycolatopsis alkalitolerans]|nr:amidohydrolase family protein [Amycolatopsis alkalitolerans]